jgi:hypothetical protein
MKYIYPKMPAAKATTPFFRLSGYGLANAFFVYGKAIVMAEKYNAKIIAPTWLNISMGPILRGERDKRFYSGLFNHKNEVTGLHRLWLLLFGKRTVNEDFFSKSERIMQVEGIWDFFQPLLGHSKVIATYLEQHVNESCIQKIKDVDFSDCVAVHVRLGDFVEDRRVPMAWYVSKIKEKASNSRVLLFSDGKDEELAEILALPNVERVFYGNAIADILAMSKCNYLIGSDSSFSAWGAFLGQVPCCFYRLEYSQILDDMSLQEVDDPTYIYYKEH